MSTPTRPKQPQIVQILQALIRASPLAIVVLDACGCVRQWSPAAEQMFGWRAEEVLGRPLPIVPETHRAEFERGPAAIHNPTPQIGYETLRQRKDGRLIDVSLWTVPLFHRDGELHLSVRMFADITERKRAEQRLHLYAARLQRMHAIDHAMLNAQSLDTIISTTLNQIHRLLPCQAAGVAIFDEPAGAAHVQLLRFQQIWAGHAEPARFTIDSLWRFPDMWATYHRYVRPDTPADELSPIEQQLFEQGMQMVLSIPLRARQVRIGLLLFGIGEPAYFSADHVASAHELADQLTIAIEQAHLYEAERRARQLAETLQDANLALTRSLDLTTVLETLLDFLGRLVPYDSASVLLFDQDGQLANRAIRGYENWTNIEHARAISFDPERNRPFHTLYSTQRSLLIPDVRDYTGWERVAGSEHVLSWFGVPLIYGDTMIGSFSVDKVDPDFFTAEHVRLAELLAAQAALAVQNAQLFTAASAANRRSQALSRRLLEVQELERRHLARELHDEIGQALTGLKMMIEIADRLPPEQDAERHARMAGAVKILDTLTLRVSELSLNLRPSILDDLGLLTALAWHINRFSAQTGIKIDFRYSGIDRRFAPAIETVVYRTVQEGLTNIARHAGVLHARVQLLAEHRILIVQIEDQGRGMPPVDWNAASSIGLSGMRERVILAGGVLTLRSAPGHGTSLLIELPIDQQAPASSQFE